MQTLALAEQHFAAARRHRHLAVQLCRVQSPPPSGLRVTWFDHSSLLIERDGKRILTDPMWGPRASPFTWLGPERWYEPPIALADLPPIDVVVVSHDHYDHLDYPTFQILKDWDTLFVVPLGVAAHLECARQRVMLPVDATRMQEPSVETVPLWIFAIAPQPLTHRPLAGTTRRRKVGARE